MFEFRHLPRDIKAHLDRYVIRQDEAKRVLAIAVCDHYNNVNYMRKLEAEDEKKARETEYTKQNVILLGPTGVGKTYLVKHIAELVGVPFVKADATKFSETGYVGGDVEDLVRELVHAGQWRRGTGAVRHRLYRRGGQDRLDLQRHGPGRERARRADRAAEADGGDGGAVARAE